MLIRPLDSTDIPIVAEWVPEVPLWKRYGVLRQQMVDQLQTALQSNDMLLVADEDDVLGKTCGFAWCIRKGVFHRSPYLKLLGVRSSHTGLGIGSALLKHLEDVIVEQSNEIFLLVSGFNTGAQQFYARHGYSKVGTIPNYVLEEVSELIFWKKLQHTAQK